MSMIVHLSVFVRYDICVDVEKRRGSADTKTDAVTRVSAAQLCIAMKRIKFLLWRISIEIL